MHEVEALSDLIHSETDRQRLLSLRQADRGRYLVPIRDQLVDLLAELEASIDFADEESVGFINAARISQNAAEILRQLRSMRMAAARGCLIRSGVHVALVGRTNVGKSSLMNKLAEKDVAIVSNIPGTTRDSLHLRLQLKSMLFNFTDTAGIRDTDDPLEMEGIQRSIKRAEEANFVILVVDKHTTEEILQEISFLLQRLKFDTDRQQLIICLNKADLAPREIVLPEIMNALQKALSMKIVVLCTSCRDASNIGIKGLTEILELLIADEEMNPDYDGNEVVLSSNRHIELLESAVLEMEAFIIALSKDNDRSHQHHDDDPALAAVHLRRCAEMVGEIAGTIVNDQVLDRLFTKFCIGK